MGSPASLLARSGTQPMCTLITGTHHQCVSLGQGPASALYGRADPSHIKSLCRRISIMMILQRQKLGGWDAPHCLSQACLLLGCLSKARGHAAMACTHTDTFPELVVNNLCLWYVAVVCSQRELAVHTQECSTAECIVSEILVLHRCAAACNSV